MCVVIGLSACTAFPIHRVAKPHTHASQIPAWSGGPTTGKNHACLTPLEGIFTNFVSTAQMGRDLTFIEVFYQGECFSNAEIRKARLGESDEGLVLHGQRSHARVAAASQGARRPEHRLARAHSARSCPA